MYPHWFDFNGLPTPFPMINPSLVALQKYNKKPNQSSHSYWGAGASENTILQMRRNRERKTERNRERAERMNISLSWVSLDPCVSLDLFVLLCWGKVQLHGLVDFPVLLAHQLQRERAVQDLWGKMNTVILKKSMYDNLIVWIWLSDYTVQAWIKWHQTYCELVVCCRDVDGVLFFAGCLYVDGASLFVLAQFLQSQSDSQIFGEVVHCGVPRSLNVPDNKFHI